MTKTHRFMSFNINGTNGDAANTWQMRKSLNLAVIKRYTPDILGLQEANQTNLDNYRQHLVDYSLVVGNCYGNTPPQEYSSILDKSSRYELLETGEFWFRETPDIESSDWGVEYPMGVTWVWLNCLITDKQLFFINTHFEDGPWGERSRVNASNLMVRRLPELASDLPVVISVDFNCNPLSLLYRIFLENGYVDTYRAAGNAGSVDSSTMHLYQGNDHFALDWGDEMFLRADWILARNGIHQVQATASKIIRDANPPTYPSDHYPVVSEVMVG